MKKIFAFALLLAFVSITVFGQDTIVFRNGDEVQAKVVKVSDAEIEFLIWNNQGGPVYVKKVADVFMVKYSGGLKDVFVSQREKYVRKSIKVLDSIQNTGGQIYDSYGYVNLYDRSMSDDVLRQILTEDEYNTFVSARKQQSIGAAFTLSGLVMSAVGLIFTFVLDGKTYGIPVMVIGDVLTTIGIPTWAIGGGRSRWVMNSYNGRMRSYNLSLSVSPLLMLNPGQMEDRSLNYGLGLTFKF